MKRFIKMIITFYYKFKYISRCRIHVFSNIILRKCKFEGKNALGKSTYIANSFLGYGSYIGKNAEFSKTIIGRYCSIGNNVKVISATHPIDKVISSHPAFYSNKFYFKYSDGSYFVEHIKTVNGYECEIKNDVWIGDNVIIKGGITIGNGAIIGMGSIVLKDVPPYAVVAGVPAKIIRYRFEDDIIKKLVSFQWWNKPLKWISEHAIDFLDPFEFVSKHCFNEKE